MHEFDCLFLWQGYYLMDEMRLLKVREEDDEDLFRVSRNLNKEDLATDIMEVTIEHFSSLIDPKIIKT